MRKTVLHLLNPILLLVLLVVAVSATEKHHSISLSSKQWWCHTTKNEQQFHHRNPINSMMKTVNVGGGRPNLIAAFQCHHQQRTIRNVYKSQSYYNHNKYYNQQQQQKKDVVSSSLSLLKNNSNKDKNHMILHAMSSSSSLSLSSSSEGNNNYDDDGDKETNNNNKPLDNVLSNLTSAFPLFVLSGAIIGLFQPSYLLWTNKGSLITWMLATVMCAMGLTLEPKDFTNILDTNLIAVPAGVLCQFCIMPLSAYFIGKQFILKSFTSSATASAATATATTAGIGPSLFLGLCLVGCAPGGTASNLVSLIAKADVALSVLLTSCSTILASILTPILVKLLVGSTIMISGIALCSATAKVVLLPICIGMIINSKAPNLSKYISRFTPFLCVLIVSLICGGVVAQNSLTLLQLSSSFASLRVLPTIITSILLLHCIGFFVGYVIPKYGLKFSESSSRTISIETGMQNSALAVVLARSLLVSSNIHPIATLPGALSATAHSCLGSALAAYWRLTSSSSSSSSSDKTTTK